MAAMKKTARMALIALVISLAHQLSIAQNPIGPPVKQTDWDFELLDANGRKHTAREWKDARAVAIFFIAAECPISNRYGPEINRLVADYSARGIAFYGVHSDPDIGPAAAL